MGGVNPEARDVQLRLFDELSRQSFAELQRLPEEKSVPLPESARGTTVCVRRRQISDDEIEVEIELRQRFLLLFHGTLRKSFRMNSAGQISDGEYETYHPPNTLSTQRRYADLPEGVEHELVRYLREEFGEHEGMPDALQVKDLNYIGWQSVGTKTVHYWQVSSERPSWGTVTNDAGRLEFSLTTKKPTQLRK